MRGNQQWNYNLVILSIDIWDIDIYVLIIDQNWSDMHLFFEAV